jgi:hypothetical protein
MNFLLIPVALQMARPAAVVHASDAQIGNGAMNPFGKGTSPGVPVG